MPLESAPTILGSPVLDSALRTALEAVGVTATDDVERFSAAFGAALGESAEGSEEKKRTAVVRLIRRAGKDGITMSALAGSLATEPHAGGVSFTYSAGRAYAEEAVADPPTGVEVRRSGQGVRLYWVGQLSER